MASYDTGRYFLMINQRFHIAVFCQKYYITDINCNCERLMNNKKVQQHYAAALFRLTEDLNCVFPKRLLTDCCLS